MTRIVIEPPEKDAKVHERDGQLLMYIGKVTVGDDTVTVVPCRGITPRNMATLTTADSYLDATREHWFETPEGWTSHVSVPVDIDGTIARMLADADEIDRLSSDS
jgi:hypothetical protein